MLKHDKKRNFDMESWNYDMKVEIVIWNVKIMT